MSRSDPAFCAERGEPRSPEGIKGDYGRKGWGEVLALDSEILEVWDVGTGPCPCGLWVGLVPRICMLNTPSNSTVITQAQGKVDTWERASWGGTREAFCWQ